MIPSTVDPRYPRVIERLAARGPLLPVLVCVAGLLAYAWPMFVSGFDLVDRNLEDGRLVNFVLEHGYRWLVGMPLHSDFWSPPVFYPYENVSAFTHLLLGFGPFYWIWRALGAEPDTAYQLWTLSVFALNFASTYWFLRRGFGVQVPAACVGALLLAAMATEYSAHPQLMPLFFVMAGMLALLRLFSASAPDGRGRRRGWIALFFAAAVLQAWSDVHAFFFFGLLVAFSLLAAGLVAQWRRTLVFVLRRDLGMWALCAGLGVACLLPLVQHYGLTAEVRGYRTYIPEAVPHLLGWILGDPARYPIAVGFAPRTVGVEPITFVAMAWGLWRWRERASVRILVVAVLSLVLVGSRAFEFAPWKYVHGWLPGAGGIRGVFRMTMVGAPLAALGLALLARPGRNVATSLVTLVLVCGAIGEHLRPMVPTSKSRVRAQVMRLARQVDPNARAFYAVSRIPDASFVADDAAWATLETGVPTINGRYGNRPPNYELGGNRLNERASVPGALEAALERWLQRHGIERGEVQWIEYEALTQRRVERRPAAEH